MSLLSQRAWRRFECVVFCGQVRWLEQQSVRRRVKRTATRSDYWKWSWNDPLWPKMWYLVSASLLCSLACVCVCVCVAAEIQRSALALEI